MVDNVLGVSHHIGHGHQPGLAGFQGGPAHHNHGGGSMGGYDDGGGNLQAMGPGAPQSGPQGKTATNLNELESMVNSITSKPNSAKLKQKVCVHWLKKVCRKGDACEYLHMYIEEKIPICKFFKETGHCHQ